MGMRQAECKWCKARIFFAVTEKGRRMPMDLHPTGRGLFGITIATDGVVYLHLAEEGEHCYDSHFATCPNIPTNRKRGARA